MEDNAALAPKRTWLGRWYDHGRESIETIELQRAKQFKLLFDLRSDLRKLQISWREAKKRQMPPEVVNGLAEALEQVQESVDDAREGYAHVAAERDRRVADNRANLSLLLSGLAFFASITALVVAVLTFLLKGWR